jgi:hypothetical protein
VVSGRNIMVNDVHQRCLGNHVPLFLWQRFSDVIYRHITAAGLGYRYPRKPKLKETGNRNEPQLPYHVTCVEARLVTLLGVSSNSECYTPSSEFFKGSDDGV